MPALTPAQVDQYYAEEGNKPNPLSPLDWLKKQTAAPGSLEKTLPGETPGSSPTFTDKALPEAGTDDTIKLDQMTLLQRVLRKGLKMSGGANLTGQIATELGGLESIGYAPEKVSGSTTANIINFIQGRAQRKIDTEITDVNDILSSITEQKSNIEKQQQSLRDDARQQISLAVSSDMWNSMDDQQRQELWTAAGYTGSPVKAKDVGTEAYHTTDEAGNVWNVVMDKYTGQVISQENLGPIGKGKGTGTEEDESQKAIAAFNKDLSNVSLFNPEDPYGGKFLTIEKFIKYLQVNHPDIDPADIEAAARAYYEQ